MRAPVGARDDVLLRPVEQREGVVLVDVDVEVLEELHLGRALGHVDQQLERVGLLLRALEVERARHVLVPGHRQILVVGVEHLADVEVGQLHAQRRAAQGRVRQLEQHVGRLDVAVAGVADDVRVLDRGGDRHHVVEHAEDALLVLHRQQVVAPPLDPRALEPLLERHVEQLEDHEVVLDLVAHLGRDEVLVVRLARGQKLHDVGVTLDPLQDLLLHLEPHRVLRRHALLEDLDRDVAPVGGLGLDPALLAQVRLGEAAGAELDRLAVLVHDERVGPLPRDVRRHPDQPHVVAGHLLLVPVERHPHDRLAGGHRWTGWAVAHAGPLLRRRPERSSLDGRRGT